MKIKSGFVLHSMGSEHVVVAVEERTKEFRGMIRLNGTGAFLWEKMQSDCTAESLAQSLVAQYSITAALAEEAVRSFIEQLSDAHILES